MIEITRSPSANTGSCDYSKVTKDTLLKSSTMHIDDVRKGILFISDNLHKRAIHHDHDKISGITAFHADFSTGFKQREWFDNHVKVNRHHLSDPNGVPNDVNLLDIIEMVVDCTMAGMARSGAIYPMDIPSEVLQKAVDNTVALIKEQIIVNNINGIPVQTIDSMKLKPKV